MLTRSSMMSKQEETLPYKNHVSSKAVDFEEI